MSPEHALQSVHAPQLLVQECEQGAFPQNGVFIEEKWAQQRTFSTLHSSPDPNSSQDGPRRPARFLRLRLASGLDENISHPSPYQLLSLTAPLLPLLLPSWRSPRCTGGCNQRRAAAIRCGIPAEEREQTPVQGPDNIWGAATAAGGQGAVVAAGTGTPRPRPGSASSATLGLAERGRAETSSRASGINISVFIFSSHLEMLLLIARCARVCLM